MRRKKRGEGKREEVERGGEKRGDERGTMTGRSDDIC